MIQPFAQLTAGVIPLDRANIDTDAILPKQFMKSIRRTGFGGHLFDEWRYIDHETALTAQREPDPDFPLNHPCRSGAQILLARANFGCGSSREHAVWALRDYGIRVLIAPSFADIFYSNCFKNGLLPIALDTAVVDRLFALVQNQTPLSIHVDLEQQSVVLAGGPALHFEIEAARKHRLLHGLDDIGLTLQRVECIRAYERRRTELEPWNFAGPT